MFGSRGIKKNKNILKLIFTGAYQDYQLISYPSLFKFFKMTNYQSIKIKIAVLIY